MIIPFGFLNKKVSVDTDSFITTWETTTSSESITIPMSSSYTYDITVSWGDESSHTTFNAVGDASTLTHTYTTAGSYNVTISNNSLNGWKGIFFNNIGDKAKIKDIVQWGTSAINILNFYGCTNLTGGTATDVPNINHVGFTNMANSFRSTSSLDITNWSSWQPYNVSNFSACYRDSTANGGDASWITSNCTNIALMYINNSGFNQNWATADMSNITACNLFNFNATGWSTENYSNTLIGWASQTLQTGETFDCGATYNSAGETARASIISTYSWTINDGGLA